MTEEVLTLAEAAALLRVSKRTVERRVTEKRLTAYRIQGTRGRRYLRSDLLALLTPDDPSQREA